MVSTRNLIPLEKEHHINNALIMGINGKIQIYVLDKTESFPRLLTLGHIASIRQAKPNLISLTFERPLQNSLTGQWNHSGKYGDYGYMDLWITQKDYDPKFSS